MSRCICCVCGAPGQLRAGNVRKGRWTDCDMIPKARGRKRESSYRPESFHLLLVGYREGAKYKKWFRIFSEYKSVANQQMKLSILNMINDKMYTMKSNGWLIKSE